MKIICAWCRTLMDENREPPIVVQGMDFDITHDICETCTRSMEKLARIQEGGAALENSK